MPAQPTVHVESTFPLLPLRGGVLFPSTTVPFEVGRPKTVALVERVVADKIPHVVVFPQREAATEDPSAADLHDLGTLARVVAVEKQRKGTYAIVVEGLARVRLRSVEQTTPYLQARVEPVE
ncbi:MAG: LON peptidase substrate-binding domain-containing protein, partial [Myxococcales bacterium]|nr:LON peptidase substrate-binding domain-containing protein [Myxococcales bacterium]